MEHTSFTDQFETILGKPFEYWLEIDTKIKTYDVHDLMTEYVMENLKLKKEVDRLKTKLALQVAVNNKLLDEIDEV